MDKETKELLMTHLQALAQLAFNMRERWKDEQGYEDFEDYREAFEKEIPEDVTFIVLKQSCDFKIKFRGWLVSVSLLSDSFKWKALK